MTDEAKQEAGRTVRFAEVGDRKGVQEIQLGANDTLKDLLAKAGVTDDREVRVNNNIASEGVELKEGDFITAIPRVVGG